MLSLQNPQIIMLDRCANTMDFRCLSRLSGQIEADDDGPFSKLKIWGLRIHDDQGKCLVRVVIIYVPMMVCGKAVILQTGQEDVSMSNVPSYLKRRSLGFSLQVSFV
jgi:hypothetical protein